MNKNAKRLIFVGLMLVSSPAWAEDVSVTTLCQMLPNYAVQNEGGASAEYQPGVDVHGRAVVPGDVNKVLNNNFDAVEIPVEYNVINTLGANLPAGSQVRPTVAMLKVYNDGRVKYNDQDLTTQAQALCSYAPKPQHIPQDMQHIQPQAGTVSSGNTYYNPRMEPKVLGQIQNSAIPANYVRPQPQPASAATPAPVAPVKTHVLRNPQDIPY